MSELADRTRTAREHQEQAAIARQEGGPGGADLLTMVRDRQAMYAESLAGRIDPGTFVRGVSQTLMRTRELLVCTTQSVLLAVDQAAHLGLDIDTLGLAYLVPIYNSKLKKKEAHLWIGYKGYIELFARAGVTLHGKVVHEADRFIFEDGLDPKLIHVPASGDRGDSVAYWVVAKTQDGRAWYHVMSRSEIETFKRRSRATDSGPWVTDYDAMALKTVVRRLVPWIPKTQNPTLSDVVHQIQSETDTASLPPASVPALDAGDQVVDVEAVEEAEVVEEKPKPKRRTKAEPKVEVPPPEEPPEYADDDPERPFA
jgi:recombination protein RecT